MKEIAKRLQGMAYRIGWVLLLPLVILFSLSSGQAQAPTEVERSIAFRAQQLSLGAPLPETPRPRQLSTSPIVWVQAFSGGRVYWMQQPAWPQVSGTLVIRGEILTRWLALGGDGSTLGFPLGEEQGCENPGQRDRYQWFMHGVIHWRADTRDTVVHVAELGPLSSNIPRICRPLPEEQDGRFRVILTGFSVNRQTNDHILEADGKGDEVYILAEVAQYDGVWSLYGQVWTDRERSGLPVLSARGKIKLRRSLASVLMGDANNQEAPRMKAGTAGDMGGFRTGDSFPTSEPWRLTGTPSANRLPMLLWEGDLRRGNDLVIIIPTIWEWDGGNIQPRQQFTQDIERYFNETVHREGTYQEDQFRYSVTGQDIAGAGDRPIGSLGRTPGIRLDFATAANAVLDRQNKYGPGVVELNYASDTENYSLYLKIERLK